MFASFEQHNWFFGVLDAIFDRRKKKNISDEEKFQIERKMFSFSLEKCEFCETKCDSLVENV